MRGRWLCSAARCCCLFDPPPSFHRAAWWLNHLRWHPSWRQICFVLFNTDMPFYRTVVEACVDTCLKLGLRWWVAGPKFTRKSSERIVDFPSYSGNGFIIFQYAIEVVNKVLMDNHAAMQGIHSISRLRRWRQRWWQLEYLLWKQETWLWTISRTNSNLPPLQLRSRFEYFAKSWKAKRMTCQ